MRRAAIAFAVAALAGCGSRVTVVAPLPPAPPADVAASCALPPVEVGETWRDAAVTHRLRLVECRGAALVNDAAWRRIADVAQP